MNPKPTSIIWFTVWRIGAIILFLSLVGYIYWLQQYTFTDSDVSGMFGAKLNRLRVNVQKGQSLRIGTMVDGERNMIVSDSIAEGEVDLTLATSIVEHNLSLGIKQDPVRWFHRRTFPMMRSGASKFGTYVNDPTALNFLLIEESDGSVWLAEWEEEINGQRKKIRFGFWLE